MSFYILDVYIVTCRYIDIMWQLYIAQRVYLMLIPDFQPCQPFPLVVTKELIKWVWLGLKTMIIVKMMVKIQKKTLNSSKIRTPLP